MGNQLIDILVTAFESLRKDGMLSVFANDSFYLQTIEYYVDYSTFHRLKTIVDLIVNGNYEKAEKSFMILGGTNDKSVDVFLQYVFRYFHKFGKKRYNWFTVLQLKLYRKAAQLRKELVKLDKE